MTPVGDAEADVMTSAMCGLFWPLVLVIIVMRWIITADFKRKGRDNE